MKLTPIARANKAEINELAPKSAVWSGFEKNTHSYETFGTELASILVISAKRGLRELPDR